LQYSNTAKVICKSRICSLNVKRLNYLKNNNCNNLLADTQYKMQIVASKILNGEKCTIQCDEVKLSAWKIVL
jgi:hypothetical protein